MCTGQENLKNDNNVQNDVTTSTTTTNMGEPQEDIIKKCKGGGSIIEKPPIFTPNGLSLVVPWRNLLRSFNVVSGERLTDYEGFDDNIVNAEFNPNNHKLLMACSRSGDIVCWKWKMELLVSKSKLRVPLAYVTSFHVFSVREYPELDDCDMLISWVDENDHHLGVFNSKTCKLKMNLQVRMKTERFKIHVGGRVGGNFMALIENNKLQCLRLNDVGKVSKYRIGNGRTFTSVACHPEFNCIATGDSSGRILLWQNLFTGSTPTQCTFHWHTLPVKCISFSTTGSEFYSGADECTVVKWFVDKPLEKKFLPRLPAPIRNIVIGPDNLLVAICTEDNGIRLVDSHFNPKSLIQHMVWGAPFQAGLVVDPNTKALVLNGRPGYLQFYSPNDQSLLYSLDIVSQNRITRERDNELSNTHVVKTATSKNGNWLATVEQRIDNGRTHELRMKFWEFDSKERTFSLNTSIDLPHENDVTGLQFQPNSTSKDIICATTGDDNCFKIWNLQDTSTIYRKCWSWQCLFSGYYKNLSANAISFSTDGSVLAVAFHNCLTLWLPDSCHMKSSLLHPNYRSPIKALQFGNADHCHLIVTASEDHLCVWNILTLGLMWMVPVEIKLLCLDPCSSNIAAISTKNNLFVFRPDSPKVLFRITDLCSKNKSIMAATFVAHGTERPLGLSWQRNSQLYMINSDQELISLETKDEQQTEPQFEFTPNVHKSLFASILAQSTTSDVKTTESIQHTTTGLPGSMSFKQLLEPPSHTMAPMRLLCGSVLKSTLITTDLTINKPETITSTDENDQEDDLEELEETTTRRRRRQIKPEIVEGDLNENPKTIDLHNVFTESTTWTSMLV